MNVIANFLIDTDFILVNWDIGGDCYNLFIIPKSKWQQLKELGLNMEIKFELFKN